MDQWLDRLWIAMHVGRIGTSASLALQRRRSVGGASSTSTAKLLGAGIITPGAEGTARCMEMTEAVGAGRRRPAQDTILVTRSPLLATAAV